MAKLRARLTAAATSGHSELTAAEEAFEARTSTMRKDLEARLLKVNEELTAAQVGVAVVAVVVVVVHLTHIFPSGAGGSERICPARCLSVLRQRC